MLREKNLILTKIYNRLPLDADAIVDEYLRAGGAAASRTSPTRPCCCTDALEAAST